MVPDFDPEPYGCKDALSTKHGAIFAGSMPLTFSIIPWNRHVCWWHVIQIPVFYIVKHHVSTRNPGSICSSLPGLDRFIRLRGRPGDAWRLYLRPDAAVHHRWQRGAAATRRRRAGFGVGPQNMGGSMGFTKKIQEIHIVRGDLFGSHWKSKIEIVITSSTAQGGGGSFKDVA